MVMRHPFLAPKRQVEAWLAGLQDENQKKSPNIEPMPSAHFGMVSRFKEELLELVRQITGLENDILKETNNFQKLGVDVARKLGLKFD